MTLTELKHILDSSGYPVAYSHFNEPPSLPYIVYLVTNSSNFFADNKVHKKIDNVQIELYTNEKNLSTENVLESVLDSNDIPYETTETYIESEQLFQKIYEVSL
jgi:hypothetical protein